MADAINTEVVAEAFIKQYYAILHQSPDNVHKFYQEESVLSWPSSDGAVTPVTTFSGIQEKIMSSDCKGCSAEVKTVDSQDSVDGGIIVAVTGSLNRADDSKTSFSQTFFLAKNETGFFVLNDILRFFNHAPSVESAACVENGKVEEVVIPVSKDTVGKDAPKSEKAPSAAAPASTTTTTPKISYASMVAKEARPASPKKAVTVASNVNNKQQVDGGLKAASTPNSDVPKAPAPSNKHNPKSPPPPPRGNYVPNTNAYPEARGIYIGRLPYDITKEGVVEVVKQFGPVRRNAETVQLRRHEDGFCCGFVEFESADSARRAVEAHHIKFGDKEAYITYKRSSSARGNNNNNDGRARSPTRAAGGLRNGGQNGADQNKGGQVRDPRLRKSPVGGRRWQSRDRSD
ncbi:hypothetical protein ACP275_12G093700 [Erythranthe tilingii]